MFFRRKTESQATAIAVVDFHMHTRGGHFGPWMKWFSSEFATRFDKVFVITPDPEITESFFRKQNYLPPANMMFHKLPDRMSGCFDVDALHEIPGAEQSVMHAFFMWAYDLPELKQPAIPGRIPWATMSGLSWHMRGHNNNSAQLELRLLDFFRDHPSFKAFVQPDYYLREAHQDAFWVPDLENIALPKEKTERETLIAGHRKGGFCVGCFGLLAGYRCLNELLALARERPDIRFVLAGKLIRDSVDPELRPLLQPGALENLLVLSGFIGKDKDLNAAINSVDALFIDGKSYPVPSGIVCRALHFGKCIITPESQSWTVDFIRQRGVGIIYQNRDDDLSAGWRSWLADGGEERSRMASEIERGKAAVDACFDGVSNRLKQN